MTPEKQRIAIAEVCGWKFEPRRAIRPGGGVVTDYPLCNQLFHVPDYPTDLNAMHEAEKVLTREQQSSYHRNLAIITRNSVGVPLWCLLHATAAQRAEAFLRTLGKWEG